MEEANLKANEQLPEEHRFDRLRVDVWKLASQSHLSEDELIERLLCRIGPELGVSRACYNECGGDVVVCRSEWCSEGVKPSRGSSLPKPMVEQLLGGRCAEFSAATLERELPESMPANEKIELAAFVERLNLDSVFAVPHYADGELEGLLTLDVCADATEKPVWSKMRKEVAMDAVELLAQGLAQRRMERSLRRSKRDLERRVAERTKELAGALEEKKLLLVEVQHRVKNNLQFVDSLLSLQSEHAQEKDLARILSESRHRVRSMAMIHERLYSTGDPVHLDVLDYVQRLGTYLLDAYGTDRDRIKLNIRVEAVKLDANRAILCGLIINELVSNALKYAFSGKQSGRISVGLRRKGNDCYTLVVSDNGKGLPLRFGVGVSRSLGLKLVGMLCEQLNAKVRVSRKNGTRFEFIFGEEGYSRR